MQNYCNKFYVAVNTDKNEVILNFTQESPLLAEATEGGGPLRVEEAPVANIVMSGTCARNLVDLLTRFLGET